jgi:DNA-binding NtrC family response regulator
MSALPVLVVDDDPFVRRSTASATRALGFQAVEAKSTEEARFVLAGHRVSAVVSDYDLMNGGTGLDVLELAEANQPAALRVLMSGNPPPGLPLALGSGLVQHFLLKPFGIAELRQILRQLPAD